MIASKLTRAEVSSPAFVKRFWARVDRSGECWTWRARRGTGGYGRLRCGQRNVPAHRVAWVLTHGDLPAGGACVLHDCPSGDNPACVNPAHLWLGTTADNNRDKRDKGREFRKLTDEQVRAIRTRWPAESQRSLALEFGIAPSLVSMLVNRQRRASAP